MDRLDFSQLLNWGWYGFLVSFSWGILLFFFFRNKRDIGKAWFAKWLIAGGIVGALTMGVVALFPPSIVVERLWAQATFGDTLEIRDENQTILGQVDLTDGAAFLMPPDLGQTLPKAAYTSLPLPKGEVFYTLTLLQKQRPLKTYQVYFYKDKPPVVYGRVMLRNGYIQAVNSDVFASIIDCIETAVSTVYYN